MCFILLYVVSCHPCLSCSFLDPPPSYAVRVFRQSRVQSLLEMMDPFRVLNTPAIILLDDVCDFWRTESVSSTKLRDWLQMGSYDKISKLSPLVLAGRHSSKAYLEWLAQNPAKASQDQFQPLRVTKFFLKSSLPPKDAIALSGLDNYENAMQAKGAAAFAAFTSQVIFNYLMSCWSSLNL